MIGLISDQARVSPVCAASEAPVRNGAENLQRAGDPLRGPSGDASQADPAVPGSVVAVPSLATLLFQARAAQAQLSAQPLPIANRDLLLIQKLFGG